MNRHDHVSLSEVHRSVVHVEVESPQPVIVRATALTYLQRYPGEDRAAALRAAGVA